MLYSLADEVQVWLYNEAYELEEFLTKHNVPFTTLTAGPFMAMFANILELETSLQVLDRVILEKSNALTSIMKHVLAEFKHELIAFKDSGLLQAFLVREIYVKAVN